MFDENRASSGNVRGTSDSSLSMEDPPTLTNQDLRYLKPNPTYWFFLTRRAVFEL